MDVRVIAATAKPLEQAVERGEFRADLYYRLNVVRLHLPPLRERPEDIPALLTHFARQAAQRLGHPVSVTPAALAALASYTLARQRPRAPERGRARRGAGRRGPARPQDFALGNGTATAARGPRNGTHGANGTNGTNGSLDLKTQVEAVERRAIQRALEASGGNRRQAASLLGISLRTLFYKMRRLPVA